MTEFAAAAAPEAEPVFVAWGLGDFCGWASLALLVGVGDFAGVLVALGLLVALAELLAAPDFVAVGEDVVARAEPVGARLDVLALAEASALFVGLAELGAAGVALTLRVLPPAAVGVGEVDGDGDGDGDGALLVGLGVVNTVLGGGGGGGVAVGVGTGTGDLDWVGVGDELGWVFKSSHCWFVPVTTDADTAAEALDAPNWSAEATME